MKVKSTPRFEWGWEFDKSCIVVQMDIDICKVALRMIKIDLYRQGKSKVKSTIYGVAKFIEITHLIII